MINNTELIKIVEKYDKVVDKIFGIICNDWDPLNLADQDPNGSWRNQEYIHYLGQVIKILLSNMNIAKVELSLIDIVADMYQCKIEEVERFPNILKKFLKLRINLKKYHDLIQKSKKEMKYEISFEQMKKLNDELDEYLRIGEELSKEKQK